MLLCDDFIINTLIQELGSTNTYERISTDERSIVKLIISILLLSLQYVLKKNKTDFLRYVGYRNFINDLIKHVSLLILVHVRLLFCPNYYFHALLLLKNIGLDTNCLRKGRN